MNTPRALRMDDVGAASKQHLRYTRRRLTDLGALRDRRAFGVWGPYDELSAEKWEVIGQLLAKKNAKLTVGVTASWVETDGSLTPFAKKYPAALKILRQLHRQGLVEIASHGLTHCVVEGGHYLPKLWGSNRKFHREFWDWVPEAVLKQHVHESVKSLNDAFETEIRLLIPPGNVFCHQAMGAAHGAGIKIVNCSRQLLGTAAQAGAPPQVFHSEKIIAFHDREIELEGIGWLEKTIDTHPESDWMFVSELAKRGTHAL